MHRFHRPGIPWGVALLILVGLAGWLLTRSPDPPPRTSSVAHAQPTAETTPRESRAQGKEASPSAEAEPATVHGAKRQEVVSEARGGVVVNALGEPIPDALVTWTAIPAAGEPGPSSETRSAPSGRFFFPEELPGAETAESFLWVTHPGYWARHQALRAGQSFGHVRFVLESAPEATVRVLDATGRSVASASLEQRLESGDESLGLAPKAFTRRFSTDENGRGNWFPVRGEVRLQARSVTGVSAPWTGMAPAAVELRIADGFRLEGLVHWEGEGPLDGELRILVTRLRGNLTDLAGETAVREDGSWGPLSIPWDAAAQYAVRVEGGNAVPDEVTLPAPHAGQTRFVELHTQAGNDLWCAMLDGWTDELLGRGTITVTWWNGSRYVCDRRTPDESGYVQFRGIPDGSVRASATSPGFLRAEAPPMVLPEEEVYTHALTMFPAGRVEGRVVDGDGAPVHDFELLYWPSSTPKLAQREPYRNRPDGTFTFESAALGAGALLAATPTQRSRTRRIEVVEGEVTEVELVLEPLAVGRGRVVDGDGKPVPSATVQLYYTENSARQGPFGPPQPVRPDGTFEIEGFPRTISYFDVSAPGHATRTVPADGRVEPLDFGDIELYLPQPLTLELSGTASCDPRSIVAHSQDPRDLPVRPFPPDGRLLYEDVRPGSHVLILRYPDGSEGYRPLTLRPGEDWTFKIPGCGSARVIVSVEIGDQAPDRLGISLFTSEDNYEAVVRGLSLPPEGEVVFEHVTAGSYRVQLDDYSTRVFDARRIELAEGEERQVALSTERRRRSILVVDEKGRPLPGVSITLYCGDELLAVERTETDGRATVSDLGESCDMAVILSHDTLGSAGPFDIEHAPKKDGDIVLTLASGAGVRVRFVDDGQPVAKVTCQLRDRRFEQPVTAGGDSNDAGEFEFPALAPDEYLLLGARDGFWPVRTRVTATPDPAVVDVPIRALGSLRLGVVNAQGLPVAGVAIGLRSLEFDQEVEAWLAEERIGAQPADLSTDAAGYLFLDGLPHGDYLWTLPLVPGSPSGRLTVPAGARGEVLLTLP